MPTNIGIATLGLSLALLPAGLNPVAVFPPFEKPRTRGITDEHFGLIFTEEREMGDTIDQEKLSRMLRRRSFRKLKKRDVFRLQQAIGVYYTMHVIKREMTPQVLTKLPTKKIGFSPLMNCCLSLILGHKIEKMNRLAFLFLKLHFIVVYLQGV